jgi:hypothetical protein
MLILISLDAVDNFHCATNGCVISSKKKKILPTLFDGHFFFNRPWHHGDQICLLLYSCQVTVGLLSLENTEKWNII